MNNFIDGECERIDASVFTGDVLYDKETRIEFKRLLERWLRQVRIWEDRSEELKKIDV